MLGVDYAGPLDEIAESIDLDVDEPASWKALEEQWEAIRPTVERLRAHDGRARVHVELAFQAVIEQDPNVFDPMVLRTHRPAIRMLIATRAIEGQIENGGSSAVYQNGVEGLLPAAIEGYRLLGLPDHAELAELILGHGWIEPKDDTPEDPAWERFDGFWFGLPEAEEARARYLLDHAEEFPS